jgi:hypothetical protein
MLEKDGEDQLKRSCRKLRIVIKSEGGGEEYPTKNKNKGRQSGLVTSYLGTAF